MSGSKASVAIVGIGTTEQGLLSGRSVVDIALEAALLAIADSGIDKSEIDGLVCCRIIDGSLRGQGIDEDIAPALGIAPNFSNTLEYGAGAFSLHQAVGAIRSGLANTVLVTYGANYRSGRRSFGNVVSGSHDWASSAGYVHVAGPAAMAARRHMHMYGTTEAEIGSISVAQRQWAQMNPRAMYRDEFTLEDYLAQPYLVEPLRRADITMISDGGVAFIVTTAERAADLRNAPAFVLGVAQNGGGMLGEWMPNRVMRPWLGALSKDIYTKSGLTPSDIDAAYLQDPTSVWVLQQLEAYGFCGEGEGGSFSAEGNTAPGGSLPVNTNGGQLSESYMWNWLQLYEAVEQLRGDAGDRQVANATTVLHAQTHDFWKGAATILSSHDQI